MIVLGSLTLYGAFLSVITVIVCGVVSARNGNPALVRITERALVAMAAFIALAAMVLQYALVTLDFSFAYVAEYTSATLNVFYRVGSMWAGQGGSLLLWVIVLSIGAMWTLYRNRVDELEMSPYTWVVFGLIGGIFITITTFMASPFERSPLGTDGGMGLNPLLQNPLQLIHPLALYAGYVFYTVPFAVVIGQLLAGKVQGPWTNYVRTWNILSWVMLTVGIILGARWAYAELGWGGYWGWDPVENASLIPWLAGTAVLHTGLTYRQPRQLKLSSVALLVAAFNLCLFGTFLTRSGVIQSVHAFGASSLGSYMGISVAAVAIVSSAILVWRMPLMHLVDPFARAHGWLTQKILTVLLLAMTIAVLWGTIFPLFARAITGQEIAVTPGFFKVVITPMAVSLLILFAVSPLLPGNHVVDRRYQTQLLLIKFVALFIGIFGITRFQQPGVAFVVAFAALATYNIVERAIPRISSALKNEKNPILSAVQAGASYIGHIGLVTLMLAITVNVAYANHGQQKFKLNEVKQVGTQTIRLDGVVASQFADRLSFTASTTLMNKDGSPEAPIVAKLDQYNNAEQLQAEVGIHATLFRDIYVVVDEVDATPGKEFAVLSVYNNPGVIWIWIGGFLLSLGGALFGLQSMLRAKGTRSDRKIDQPKISREDRSSAGQGKSQSQILELLSQAIALSESGSKTSTNVQVQELIDTATRLAGQDSTNEEVTEFLKLARAQAHSSNARFKSRSTLILGGVSCAFALMIAAYFLGKTTTSSSAQSTGETSSSTASPTPVNATQVAELKEKISADPEDTKSIWALGNTYFGANDYESALTYYTQLSSIIPDDADVWIAIGAAAFNAEKNALAKSAWDRALEINPDNVEAHYNLGFWYLSQEPADRAAALISWNKVVEIDPTSNYAKKVEETLKSLATTVSEPTP